MAEPIAVITEQGDMSLGLNFLNEKDQAVAEKYIDKTDPNTQVINEDKK